VASAIDQAGAEVRVVRIATLGADVVDAFYLVGSWSDPAARENVEAAILTAAA
jgi:[protein-PII] uridylyltransferase